MKRLKVLSLSLLLLMCVPLVMAGCASDKTIDCVLGQDSQEVKITNKAVNFKIDLQSETNLSWSVTLRGDGGVVSTGYLEIQFRDSQGTVLQTGLSIPSPNNIPAGTYFLRIKVRDEYSNRYGFVRVRFSDRNA